MKFLYKSGRFLIRIAMRFLWGIKVIGEVPSETLNGYIIAANHISLTDPPFIGSIMPFEVFFMAKSELFKNKFFGKLIKYLNAIPIKRGYPDIKAISTLSSLIKNKKAVLIFPEGSRKKFTALPGVGLIAHKTKASVLPVYVQQTNSFIKCLFRINKPKIIIGKPIPNEKWLKMPSEKKTYSLYATHILEVINRLKDEN